MKHAFTLIELLVVVLIIGILAAIALPQYQVAVLKARFVQLTALADSMYQAQQIYHLANGSYADDLDKLDIQLPPGTSRHTNSADYSWGYCYNDPVYQDVLCKFEPLMYIRHLSNNTRYCRVYDGHSNTSAAQQVCKSLGGTNPKTNSSDHYTQYTLP